MSIPATLEQVLAHVRAKGLSPTGIRTAADYIASAADVPSQLAALVGADDGQVREAIGKGRSALVYCDPRQTVTAYSRTAAGAKGVGKADGKDLPMPVEGSIFNFEAITTSKNQDRDGDELMPMGCAIDPALPLLWQHMPFQPIGRMTGVLAQTDELIKQAFAVADVPLGRDAVTLIEFGALRISQGFQPKKFEAIRRGEWDIVGFKIYEWDMLEVSLVSIPANTDAVITAFSRGKLHTPLVKQWAKSFHDARPLMVAAAPSAREESVTVNININGEPAGTKAFATTGTGSPAPPPAPKPVKADGPPPKEEGEPKEEPEEKAKPPALAELHGALAAMCKDEALDPVVRSRINTVATILDTASAGIQTMVDEMKAAADSMDIIGMVTSANALGAAYGQVCQTAMDEIDGFAGGDGVPDTLAEIKDQLAALHAAVSPDAAATDPNAEPSEEDGEGETDEAAIDTGEPADDEGDDEDDEQKQYVDAIYGSGLPDEDMEAVLTLLR